MSNLTTNLLAFVLLLITTCCTAQDVLSTLNTSRLSHTFSNNGFTKKSYDFEDHYSMDNNSQGFSIGFATGILISGYDSQQTLQVSQNLYSPELGFLPGILLQDGLPMSENHTYFNRIWNIKSEDINQAITAFEEGDINESNISKDILEWPAVGNPHFGYQIEETLAPFYDKNADGIYNALEGDLPIVLDDQLPEAAPSSFAYCVYYNNINNLTQGPHHTLQIEQFNYVFDCVEDDLENSVFSRLRITNKSTDALHNAKFGLYKDFDLGCFTDDKVGSHEATNSVYAYNENVEDISPCIFNYHSIPAESSAIYSASFLSHSLHSSMPVYTMHPLFGQPALTTDVDNLLNGRFYDGTPLTTGGDGYNPASQEFSLYIFPDFPNVPDGWHMNNEDALHINAIIPSIDLSTLEPGSSTTIDFVETVLPYDVANFDIFDTYEARVEGLKSAFEEIVADPTSYVECYAYNHCTQDCVWPGDVNDNGRVEADDAVYLATMSGDIIAGARNRNKVSSLWQPYHSDSWMAEKANIDYKYGDVNGNGEINHWDLQLLANNFKLSNDSYEKLPDVFPHHDPMGIGIEIYNTDEIQSQDGLLARLAKARISLGDESQNISTPIHALSFDLLIDTNLVFFSPWFLDEGDAADEAQYYYELEDSQNPPIIEIRNYSERQSFVFYQLDTPMQEGGLLMNDLTIAAHPLGTTTNPNGEEQTSIRIANILALDKDGNEIDLGVRFEDSVLVKDIPLDPSLSTDPLDANGVLIYPNPVHNLLQIDLKAHDTGTMNILHSNGRLMHQSRFDGREIRINSEAWPSGVYLLNITGTKHIIDQKIIKI